MRNNRLHPEKTAKCGLTIAVIACLLFANSVTAQEQALWQHCPSNFVPEYLQYQPKFKPPEENDKTVIFADQATASGLEEFQLSGDVQVHKGRLFMQAKEVQYQRSSDLLRADGGIRFETDNVIIVGDKAEMALGKRRGTISAAQIWLEQNHLRGQASEVQLLDSDRISLSDALITSCMLNRNDWQIKASEVSLDRENNEAVAWHARLELFDVPILYSPYLSFPISGRKSGFLAPDLGTSNVSGTEISIPYYWNIAPHRDATITPHYYSKRGTQLNSEFRYLNASNKGKLYFEYLPDDRLYGDDRSFVNFEHRGEPGTGWRTNVEYRYASDEDYFNEFGGDLGTSSTEHLERRLDVHYQANIWSASVLAQNFLTLDESTLIAAQPYRLVPQVRFGTSLLPLAYGIQHQLNTELVRFDRPESLRARRLDIYPQLQWPQRKLYGFLTPRLALRYTRYQLSNQSSTVEENPTRTVPSFSLDSGLFFERDMRWGRAVLQTLEPRLFYLYVPYKDQSNVLVNDNGAEQTFDSAATDFSFSHMFRENRYSGIDRIGDANQLSAALTSRFYNQKGVELLSASLGQIYYFRDRKVTLPGESVQTERRSDLILQLRSQWTPSINLTTQLLGEEDWSELEKGSFKFRYTPDQDTMLSLAYRYQKSGSAVSSGIDQTDATLLWPFQQQWKFVARWHYSLQDSLTLENIEGIQYDSCCWALRLVHRRYLADIDEGTHHNNVLLQLELKGLANVGSDINRLFSEGILD